MLVFRIRLTDFQTQSCVDQPLNKNDQQRNCLLD